MTHEIERALRFFLRRRSRAERSRPAGLQPPGLPSSEAKGDKASFRATVDLRLSNLERQLDEVKGRINGLLFLLAGAVATQVVLKLLV